jgi:hypothetical protein
LTIGIVRGTKKEVIAVSSNKQRPAHREFQKELRRTGTSHEFEELLVFQCVRKIRLKNGKAPAAPAPKERKTFVSVAQSALSRLRGTMKPATPPSEPAATPAAAPVPEAATDPAAGPNDTTEPPSPPAQEPTPLAPSKAFAKQPAAPQKPKGGLVRTGNVNNK